MKKNIGTPDRMVRLCIALVCCGAAFFVPLTAAKIILIAVGLFSLYEAVIGWCALYALLGKNTCPIE